MGDGGCEKERMGEARAVSPCSGWFPLWFQLPTRRPLLSSSFPTRHPWLLLSGNKTFPFCPSTPGSSSGFLQLLIFWLLPCWLLSSSITHYLCTKFPHLNYLEWFPGWSLSDRNYSTCLVLM